MEYDYSKILGLIKEKHFTQEKLAKSINVSPTTLNLKLNNKRDFTQPEIKMICENLGIHGKDVGTYFFSLKT